MRSRHVLVIAGVELAGIISACAEQTEWCWVAILVDMDHLRVCGADWDAIADYITSVGSSPRVRSRHGVRRFGDFEVGIISACAEQTRTLSDAAPWDRDHLRVCGADTIRDVDLDRRRGSSPRVRSRLRGHGPRYPAPGIISACAEQTGRSSRYETSSRDHLRVCGADAFSITRPVIASGSSPRVRSRREPRSAEGG